MLTFFFKIKNNTNEKELKDSYDLIPSQKGNILLIKNSLVGLLISIIGNDNDEKAFIFLGLKNIFIVEKLYIIYSIFYCRNKYDIILCE
jgi:hypothetical protein